MRVVLDVRPHDPLAGPVVAREVVVEPGEVLLEVVLLHIRAAEGHEHRGRRRRQEAGVGLEATPAVCLVRPCPRQPGPLADDLRQEGGVRSQGLGELLAGKALDVGRCCPRDVEPGCRAGLLAHIEVKDEEAPAGVLCEPHIVPAEQVAGVVLDSDGP